MTHDSFHCFPPRDFPSPQPGTAGPVEALRGGDEVGTLVGHGHCLLPPERGGRGWKWRAGAGSAGTDGVNGAGRLQMWDLGLLQGP